MALTLSTGLVNGMLGKSGGTPEGKGLSELLTLGCIKLYGSPRPSSADDAETGTLLVTITDASQAWTVTTGLNGLNWDDPGSGAVTKAAAQTWSGVGVAAGTAVWGRFYPADAGGTVTGASTTLARFDFSVGTSGADLNMSSTSVAVGATQTIDSFSVSLPNGE